MDDNQNLGAPPPPRPLKRTASRLSDLQRERSPRVNASLLVSQRLHPTEFDTYPRLSLPVTKQPKHSGVEKSEPVSVPDYFKRRLPFAVKVNQWLSNLPLSFGRGRARSDSFLLGLDIRHQQDLHSRIQLDEPAFSLKQSFDEEESDMDEPRDSGIAPESKSGPTIGTGESHFRVIAALHGLLWLFDTDKLPDDISLFIKGIVLVPGKTTLQKDVIPQLKKHLENAQEGSEGVLQNNKYWEALIPSVANEAMMLVVSEKVKMNNVALPRDTTVDKHLPTPMPDKIVGTMLSQFTKELQVLVLNSSFWEDRLCPNKNRLMIFPCMIWELKCEKTGGSRWKAQNQAHLGASIGVNGANLLLSAAQDKIGEKFIENKATTCCFSCVVTAEDAQLWVHYLENGKNIACNFATYSLRLTRDLQNLQHHVDNIIRHNVEVRRPILERAMRVLGRKP